MLVKNLSIEIRNLNKDINENDELISNLTEENAGWANKYKKLVAKTNVNAKPVCLACPVLREKVDTLETEKSEIEKNKVTNEKELKEKWIKELEATKLNDVKKTYASKFVPKTGLGYKVENSKKNMTSSHEKQKMTNHKSYRNSSYHDPKIVALYQKSGEIFKMGIDFEKRKTYTPYRPAHSKYAGLPSQRLCW